MNEYSYFYSCTCSNQFQAMKKWILLCIGWLPAALIAQQIIASEELPLRNDVAYEVIGNLKGKVLLFRDQTTNFEIQAFDEQMKLSWSKDLELDKKTPKVLSIAPFANHFTILYRFRQRNHVVLKAHKYDPAANLKDSVTIKDYGFLFYTPNFEVIQSEDKSKMLVYYVENQQTFHMLAFDAIEIKLLWEQSFTPDEFSFWEEFTQMLISNEGKAYAIISKNRFRAKKENPFFDIHEFSAQGGYKFGVTFQTFSIYDISFAFDNMNTRLTAAGFYAEKNLERAAGYFYLSLSPDAPDTPVMYFEPFDDELVTNLMGKTVENNKGITEIAVKELVLRRDGGLLMIAERNRQLERRLGSNNRVFFDNGTRYIVDYYYDELLVISFHPDGKTHWKTILHKKQYSQDDDGIYSSFFLFKSPGNLRLIYNDEIRYENTVSEYVVYGDGKFDRKSLLSTENLEMRLRFRDATQVSASAVIIPSERRSRLRLVRLEYE